MYFSFVTRVFAVVWGVCVPLECVLDHFVVRVRVGVWFADPTLVRACVTVFACFLFNAWVPIMGVIGYSMNETSTLNVM